MTHNAQFWDGIAEKYAVRPVRDEDAYRYTLDRIRAHLEPSDRVLELGCGTGTTALKLADAVQQITATDFAPNMIEIGQKKAQEQGIENVDFVAQDVGAATEPRAPYDAVLALNLLHLLDDLPEELARIHAGLKPGGLFISKTLCVPDSGFNPVFIAIRALLPLLQLFGKAPSVHFYKIASLEALITKAGFEILETGNHPAKPPSRLIIARKL